MTKYWQENPNHFLDWGERGGLPIEPRTIKHKLDVVALLVDQNDKAITDSFGNFVLVGNITILYGGVSGRAPINATERQKEREFPGSSPAYSNVLSDINLGYIPTFLAQENSTGNWYVSLTPFGVGYTYGYAYLSGGSYYFTLTPTASSLNITLSGGTLQIG